MTHEEMANELRRSGWRVQPPINQATCKHEDQTGTLMCGPDGSGSSSWHCRICGANGHNEWAASRTIDNIIPMDAVGWRG